MDSASSNRARYVTARATGRDRPSPRPTPARCQVGSAERANSTSLRSCHRFCPHFFASATIRCERRVPFHRSEHLWRSMRGKADRVNPISTCSACGWEQIGSPKERWPTRLATNSSSERRSEKSFTGMARSEEHTSELQSHHDLVCRLLLEKKNRENNNTS